MQAYNCLLEVLRLITRFNLYFYCWQSLNGITHIPYFVGSNIFIFVKLSIHHNYVSLVRVRQITIYIYQHYIRGLRLPHERAMAKSGLVRLKTPIGLHIRNLPMSQTCQRLIFKLSSQSLYFPVATLTYSSKRKICYYRFTE